MLMPRDTCSYRSRQATPWPRATCKQFRSWSVCRNWTVLQCHRHGVLKTASEKTSKPTRCSSRCCIVRLVAPARSRLIREHRQCRTMRFCTLSLRRHTSTIHGHRLRHSPLRGKRACKPYSKTLRALPGSLCADGSSKPFGRRRRSWKRSCIWPRPCIAQDLC